MPKIKHTGDEPYSGTDPGNGHKPLNLQPGDTADVSDAKLEQLLTDFPGRFKKARGAKPAGATGSDDVKTYAELDGAELREFAASRDIAVDGDDDSIRALLIAGDKADAEAAKA